MHWDFNTFNDCINLLKSKIAQINKSKLSKLSFQRSLVVRACHLNTFKKLLHAVGNGHIPRVHSLVNTMLKNGTSIYAILGKVGMASCQIYSPENYEDAKYKQMLLFHRLRGVAVAELAHQAQGLPSIDATRHHILVLPLVASPKTPTQGEMKSNIDINYPPGDSALTHAHCTEECQLQVDESKIECRM